MSGLLRRIKRSRAAGAGEIPAEPQDAAPERAPTTAETAVDAPARENAPTAELDARAGATPPAIQADPAAPAGLDPDEAALRPPAGRRGRLRRRLRYLRRARELMLRDLGGLLFEVHRTSGGDVGAHSGVIAAKVQRLASLDAEAHAIETALGAGRAEAVVFQPGVGGTCEVCGELYGSAARFCSNCGTPTGSAAQEASAPIAIPATAGDAGRAPAAGEAATTRPASDAPRPASDAPRRDAATGDAGRTPQRDAATGDAGRTPGAGDAATTRPASGAERTSPGEPGPDRDHFTGQRNGRADDRTPPDRTSGDPLAPRESRS